MEADALAVQEGVGDFRQALEVDKEPESVQNFPFGAESVESLDGFFQE